MPCRHALAYVALKMLLENAGDGLNPPPSGRDRGREVPDALANRPDLGEQGGLPTPFKGASAPCPRPARLREAGHEVEHAVERRKLLPPVLVGEGSSA